MTNGRQMNFRKLISAAFITLAAIACKKNDDGTVIISNNDYEFDVYFTKEDSQFCGEIFTISDTYGKCYIFEEMEYGFPYCDEMIECLVN